MYAAISFAASLRTAEKLGKSFKSIIKISPLLFTMQSPPYMSSPMASAAENASSLSRSLSNG